jgi:phage tail-like protein
VALALRLDPFLGYRFLVEIEGLIVAGFTEVTGLQAEISVQQYAEGGQNAFEHKLPGPARYPNLVLKRGLTDIDNLWRWHRDVAAGTIRRRNGSVVLVGEFMQLQGIWRWNFRDAYPVKWTGPDLRAESATVAVESVELAHRGLVKSLLG